MECYCEITPIKIKGSIFVRVITPQNHAQMSIYKIHVLRYSQLYATGSVPLKGTAVNLWRLQKKELPARVKNSTYTYTLRICLNIYVTTVL